MVLCTEEERTMMVILVSGLWTYQCPIWPNIRSAYERYLPSARFEIAEIAFCQPVDWRIQNLIRSVIKHCRDAGDLLLIGHSMGGVWAHEIARELAPQVRGIVTIFSPLGYMKCEKNTAIPIVSFGATRDELVPARKTRHPQSWEHEDLECNHLHDLAENPALAEQIAATTMRHIKP